MSRDSLDPFALDAAHEKTINAESTAAEHDGRKAMLGSTYKEPFIS